MILNSVYYVLFFKHLQTIEVVQFRPITFGTISMACLDKTRTLQFHRNMKCVSSIWIFFSCHKRATSFLLSS